MTFYRCTLENTTRIWTKETEYGREMMLSTLYRERISLLLLLFLFMYDRQFIKNKYKIEFMCFYCCSLSVLFFSFDFINEICWEREKSRMVLAEEHCGLQVKWRLQRGNQFFACLLFSSPSLHVSSFIPFQLFHNYFWRCLFWLKQKSAATKKTCHVCHVLCLCRGISLILLFLSFYCVSVCYSFIDSIK